MPIVTRQFLKFLLIGGLNTLFGYSLFALFIFLGIHFTLASLLSTILGILFNFKTTGGFVFQNKNNRLIYRFFVVYTVVYLLNIALLKLLNSNGFDLYFAGAIITLPLAIVTFLLN